MFEIKTSKSDNVSSVKCRRPLEFAQKCFVKKKLPGPGCKNMVKY